MHGRMELKRAWTDKELVDFIAEASLATYASSGEKLQKSYRPGCEEYLYERGDWKYLDSYAWVKDGGGEEIVYYKNIPVWVMNYYGFLIDTDDTKTIYGFMREALRLEHPELPVRGAPLEDPARGLRYEIEFERKEIGNFNGKERIYLNGEKKYECYIHGGLVIL